MYFTGGSFGGGLGALALPWDNRFALGHLHVPTFAHHPIRNEYRSEGSGKSVADYVSDHPDVMDLLAYYDAATAASQIQIPVIGAPAVFDPKVPPPGQFAVTNTLPETGKICILRAGHFEYPGQQEDDRDLRSQLRSFFS